MDKTIEVVVVAMVILIAATILLFLVQDQTSSFDGFLSDKQSGAECELLKAQNRCGEFDNRGCEGSCEPEEDSGDSEQSDTSSED